MKLIMKKWLIALAVLWCCPAVTGQVNYTIKIDLSGIRSGDQVAFNASDREYNMYRIRYRILDPGKPVILSLPYATVQQIQIGYAFDGREDESPVGQVIFVDRPAEYVISGTVARNTPLAPLMNTTVTGGLYDIDSFAEFVELTKEYLSLEARMALLDKDDELAEELLAQEMLEFEAKMEEGTDNVLVRTIRANPDSELAVFLLANMHLPLNPDQALELFGLLSDRVLESQTAMDLRRRMGDFYDED